MVLFFAFALKAQNNVGIGTTTPHPSAILEVTDSSRGVLIPRTDTMGVLEYVNTLNPNPGIADGLMIFDTNLNTYLYYNELDGAWKNLLNLVGPRGYRGATGPTGPRGDTGVVNDWRDSSGFDQKILGRDTCGDWFFDASNGRIWGVWCDTLGGNKPRMWRDTVIWDKPIGNLQAPDERIFAFNLPCGTPLLESMANDTAIVVMKNIQGLSQSITVFPDENAYIWFAGFGTASKAFDGQDMSYAQYDVQIGNDEYYRSGNVQQIVSIGPNGPPSNSGRADFAGWYVSGFYFLEGDITDPCDCRCFTPYQKVGCGCSYSSKTVDLQVKGGNRYSGSSTTSFLVLADAITKENVGHLEIFCIIRRNPDALPRKR